MLVLAAPASEDPRDDGFAFTVPGELVISPAVICDSGRDGTCGCERSWTGLSSYKSTTVAIVRDQDITKKQYVSVVSGFYIESHGWMRKEAIEQARQLLLIAGDCEPGTLISVGLTDDGYVCYEALEPEDG